MFRISPRNSQFEHALRNSFTVSNVNRTLTVTSIKSVKLCLHVPISKIQIKQKIQGAFPYYLIVVHEEAGDECAHAQLLEDRFRLRYRDTSLPASSKKTRTLPKTESWVAAWLEFFFRPTSELLLDVVDEDGGQLAR
jgi:hypothetical protein